MIYDLAKKNLLKQMLFTFVILLAADLTVSGAAKQPTDVNLTNNKSESEQQKIKPIIIWFHNGATDSLESLNTALSSGLINHVMILYMNRADADWRANQQVVNAIDTVKKSGAKLIWTRTLWATYNNKEIRPEILFDPNYYIEEIRSLRSEAAQMGADFVALDTEPYGNTPLKEYLRGSNKLTTQQRERLKRVIQQVVETVGTIDFILPAGSMDETHPCNVLSGLGQYRIAENTYYSNLNTIKSIKYPYEIFGAYVNTIRENPEHPAQLFFTASQIFEESSLWSGKKGLFVYPRERQTLAVARQLAAYANNLPRTDLTIGTEVNISQ